MYCIHCGGANKKEANFCKKCGVRLVGLSNLKHEDFKNNFESQDEDKKFDGTLKSIKNKFTLKPSWLNRLKLQGIFFQTRKTFLSMLWKIRFNSKLVAALVIFGVLIGAPFASAYVKYFQINTKAEKAFNGGEYGQALDYLKTVNTKRLLPPVKSRLQSRVEFFGKIKEEDSSFQLAKTEEEKGNLGKAKELLVNLSDKSEYPNGGEVVRELSKVSDAITEQVKKDADTKVAAAQKKSDEQAARAKSDAAKAAANAAANQAAAEAARQQAQQQAAAAQAGAAAAAEAARQAQANAARIAAEADAAQDTAYINSFSSASTILLRCRQETNDASTAYVAGNTQTALNYLLLAVNDCGNVQNTLLNPYPAKFGSLNTAIINAANSYQNGAYLHYQALLYSDVDKLNQAYNYYNQGENYINQIRNLLNSI